MGLPLRDRERHTYGEYLAWPDGVRYELIDGDAYLTSPAPAPQHQRLVGELFRQIADAVQDSHCEVFVAPFDVRLPRPGQSDEETDTVVQPDLTIVCDPAKIDDRGCRGAPDWVIAGHRRARSDRQARRVRACWGARVLVRAFGRSHGRGVPANGRALRPADDRRTGG